MEQTMEQKLKKRGSKDLLKKMNSPKSTQEEIKVISAILEGRGVGQKKSSPKSSPSKTTPKKRKPNMDIVAAEVAVGDVVTFKAKSKDENNGKMIEGTVIKVYRCNRSQKSYVRIKAVGRIFHKALTYFEKKEDK